MWLICWLFGHAFELVAISDLYEPSDDAAPPHRAKRVSTQYHYKCDCCGHEAINPYDEGEQSCSAKLGA